MAEIHILPLPTSEQSFDEKTYEYTLPKAGKFKVAVKELLEEERLLKEDKEQLEKERREVYEYAKHKWEQHAVEGWSKKKLNKNYDANIKAGEEKRNLKARIEAHNKKRQAFKEKKESLAWKWEVRTDIRKRLDLTDFNDSLGENVEQELTFPKVLEGGGYAWIEPFDLMDGAKGTQPNGCYVRAIGKPKIVGAKWTSDKDGNSEIKKAQFNQKVYLHIETEGLYGKEVKISLIDKEQFLWIDALDGDETITDEKDYKYFEREIKVYPVSSNNTDKVTDSTHVQKTVLELFINPTWKAKTGEVIHLFAKVYYQGKELQNSIEKVVLDVQNSLKKPEDPTGNVPVTVFQIDTDVANFHPCRYEKISANFEEDGEPKKIPLFDSESPTDENQLIFPFVAGNDEARRDFEIIVDGAKTDDCFFEGSGNHKNVVIDTNRIEKLIQSGQGQYKKEWRAANIEDYLKGGEKKTEKSGDQNDDRKIDVSHITNKFTFKNGGSSISTQKAFKVLEKQSPFEFGHTPDQNMKMRVGYDFSRGGKVSPLVGLCQTFLPNNPSLALRYPLTIKTCAFTKKLDVLVYPDTKWTLQLGFNYDKAKFNKIREQYHEKWQLKEFEAEEEIKRLEAKKEGTSKHNKKWVDKNIKAEEQKLDKANSKTSKKGQASKAFDLMEPDDALENGLIDCEFAMIAEFDRPYQALELTSGFDELIGFIKKIADITEKVNNIIDGKDERANEKAPSKENSKVKRRKEKLQSKADSKVKKWSFEFIPPSIATSLSWYAERPKDIDKPIMGTMIEGVIDFNPFFGFEIKYDLYQLLYRTHPVVAAVAFALDVLDEVAGDKFDINLDLFVTTTAHGTLKGSINTAQGSNYKDRLMKDEDDTPAKFGGNVTIKIVAELYGEAKVDSLFFGKLKAYAGVDAGIQSGITIELVTKIDEEGKLLYLEPEIKFEGFILFYGVDAGISVDMDEEETKESDGIHFTNSGEIIVVDAYEWEIKNWRIPLLTF